MVPSLGVFVVVLSLEAFFEGAPAKVSAQYFAVASNEARSDK